MAYSPFEQENEVYRKLEFLVKFPVCNITVKDTVSYKILHYNRINFRENINFSES